MLLSGRKSPGPTASPSARHAVTTTTTARGVSGPSAGQLGRGPSLVSTEAIGATFEEEEEEGSAAAAVKATVAASGGVESPRFKNSTDSSTSFGGVAVGRITSIFSSRDIADDIDYGERQGEDGDSSSLLANLGSSDRTLGGDDCRGFGAAADSVASASSSFQGVSGAAGVGRGRGKGAGGATGGAVGLPGRRLPPQPAPPPRSPMLRRLDAPSPRPLRRPLCATPTAIVPGGDGSAATEMPLGAPPPVSPAALKAVALSAAGASSVGSGSVSGMGRGTTAPDWVRRRRSQFSARGPPPRSRTPTLEQKLREQLNI